MAKSAAADVDAYIAEAPPDRAPALRRIAELCRATLPDHEERMQWGMPGYFRNGQAEWAFASQKQYVALYVMIPAVAARNSERLAGQDMGKGCLRFNNPAAIDFDLLQQLLADTRDHPAS